MSTDSPQTSAVETTLPALTAEQEAYLEKLQGADVKPGDPRMQTVIGRAKTTTKRQ